MLRFVNYTIDELCAEVDKGRRTLVCYGAGRALRNFLTHFAEYHMERRITAVIDQRAACMGGALVPDTNIPIRTLSEVLDHTRGKLLILVTCQYLHEVYELLQAEPTLTGSVDHVIAFHGFVTSQYYAGRIAAERQEEPKREAGVHIPKVIHYCWFGRNPLPERYQAWMESWKKYCPDYEIVEWNEDNYDVHVNSYMEEAYEAKKWGFVSDYARLDILYQYGGIYLDTDVELVRSLDDLLEQRAFAGFQDSCVSLGLGFGAVPHHEALRGMRDAYEKMHFRRKDGSLNQVQCPAYQTAWLVKHGLVENGKRQSVAGIEIYPCSWFSPLMLHNRRLVMNANTHSIHHFDSSWSDQREKHEWNALPALYDRIENIHE